MNKRNSIKETMEFIESLPRNKMLYQSQQKWAEASKLYKKLGKLVLVGKHYGVSLESARQMYIRNNRVKSQFQKTKKELRAGKKFTELSIDSLHLSTRAKNCLLNRNITTIELLIAPLTGWIYTTPNMGENTLLEIVSIRDEILKSRYVQTS